MPVARHRDPVVAHLLVRWLGPDDPINGECDYATPLLNLHIKKTNGVYIKSTRPFKKRYIWNQASLAIWQNH